MVQNGGEEEREMNTKLFTKEAHVPSITHDEWLSLRKTGIGGSDAGAILGLNKFSSPFLVYCEKLGLTPAKEENEAMKQGKDLEEYVAKRFCEKENKTVKKYNYLIRSKKYYFALADIDRMIVGEDAILECKTTSSLDSIDFENGEIPPYWYCQTQHYLAVTGCDVCYLAVIVLGKAYYCFKIERNEEDINALMEIERKFWEENVLAKVEPTPDGSKSAAEVISGLYAQSNEETPELDLTIYTNELSEYHLLEQEIAERTARRDQIKQELQLYLKDATRGVGENVKISWKSFEKRILDGTRLKAEMPDIYDKYSKITVQRPFRINFSEE